jgi:succinate-semialdehyde dehydrogenase/glutarate-semialdehyde dehydrogenase
MATEYLSLSFKFINMISINPYTKEEIATYTEFSPDEMIQLIEKNHQAFLKWKQRSYNDRSPHFRNLAKLLREQKEKLGRIITAEMGKVFSESVAEIEKCAWLCEYYADNTETLLKPEFYEADTTKSYVRFDPIGPVYGIMPWNFPFWQALRAAVPTMMAGNSFLLKHAPNVQGCAVAMENLFIEAGFPKYLFANLIISIELSDEVIANPLVQGVTLTGSRRAGQAVASVAGRHLKKPVMELGGSTHTLYWPMPSSTNRAKPAFVHACLTAVRFALQPNVLSWLKRFLINLWKSKKPCWKTCGWVTRCSKTQIWAPWHVWIFWKE